jgi:hypothetical protein
MQPNVRKTAMPTAAGILSIISGAFKLLAFLVLIVVGLFWAVAPYRLDRVRPEVLFGLAAFVLLVLGVLSIIGGVYCLRRKNFGLSLAGAIAALLPFNLLGIAAVILVAMSKPEFDVVNQPPQPGQPAQPSPPSQPTTPG